MEEFELIRKIIPTYYRQPSVVKGVGDDAFVFRSSEDIVFTTDTMVEEVHFSRKTMDTHAVGYRALAANVSDLAAMGSRPAFYSVSLVLTPDWTDEEIIALYDGMEQLAGKHSMDLVGGDTVSGSQTVVAITAHGYLPPDKGRYRSDAEDGDVIFVTGTLGDSRGGLEELMNPGESVSGHLIARHRYPEPKAEFAAGLTSLSRLCLNDISDGIASEANEIATASGVRLHLQKEKVPVSEELRNRYPDQAGEWALSGGEDFELLGTVAPGEKEALLEKARELDIRLTFIGTVSASDLPEVLLHSPQGTETLQPTGYTHLKERRKRL
ncbi:thiamine-phosphate kinase [Salimicrobium salexigens]|uniref:Thiamine-monophosphate kinase n=1 Tax=Salimicrobium salexigens TaxID=908941 RepID=A0ABY1KZG4_9BACI|nr:thiamine-phosphate kinase [Salimicrobium salexigens]SIS97539.1 thiamine-phosphate kinase [Salimicrobium salexigens]